MSEPWLTSLITDTPQAGFDLAVTLSRRGVKTTQPDMEVLQKLRPVYANDADSLTAASQVIAINFQIFSAAINYLRKLFGRFFLVFCYFSVGLFCLAATPAVVCIVGYNGRLKT